MKNFWKSPLFILAMLAVLTGIFSPVNKYGAAYGDDSTFFRSISDCAGDGNVLCILCILFTVLLFLLVAVYIVIAWINQSKDKKGNGSRYHD